MSSFITLDNQKLLDGELCARKASGGKIAFFELCKSFGVKLGLELFQNIRKFCDRVKVSPDRIWLRSEEINWNKVAKGKRVRTEDQEVRRRVLSLPRGSGHKERGGEGND